MKLTRSCLVAAGMALLAVQAPAADLSFSVLSAAPGAYTAPVYATPDAARAYSYTGSSNHALAPLGASGNYLSLERDGVATVELHGASSYSFLWGSPDTYNFIDVATSDGNVRFGGSDLATLGGFSANGSNANTSLLTITAAPGETLDSITFRSSGVAFEVAEAAVSVTAVPEAGTSALMLVGLGLLAACGRRRSTGSGGTRGQATAG